MEVEKAVDHSKVGPPPARVNPAPGKEPAPSKALVTCDDPVLRAEYEFILSCFDDLKAQEDAELRISVTRARESKQVEIIYAGIHKKRSLEPLRSIYRARDKGGAIRG